MEASAKFEGKWLMNATLNSEPFPQVFWLSTKQMNCVQKNLKNQGMLWAAIDYTKPDKPRFIWLSTDQSWLRKSFVKEQEKKEFDGPSTLEQAQVLTNDDIPF